MREDKDLCSKPHTSNLKSLSLGLVYGGGKSKFDRELSSLPLQRHTLPIEVSTGCPKKMGMTMNIMEKV